MALILTNGTSYITHGKNGRILKTLQIEEAQQFYNVNVATRQLLKAPNKCKGYYVFDTDGDDKPSVGRQKNRKRYPMDVRQIIYDEVNGHCALCGRKILIEEMTLDHIIPLAMGGIDDVKNLQCTCFACNQFKGSILPEDFQERITEIFMYQMERKHADRLKWKIIHRLLEEML